MDKKPKKDNPHAGHRERMKNKFLENPSVLEDHEIVEMLLYNAIPRGNTNEQAHQLLKLAGGIGGILDLEKSVVTSVFGLGDNADYFIKLIREFYIRIQRNKLDPKKSRKLTKNNIDEKLHKIFLGEKEEKFVMITLDNNFKIIKTNTISKGTDTSAVVPIKKIVQTAMADEAKIVLLAHNHPSGALLASEEDIRITQDICNALSFIDVIVYEHYIVTDNSMVGIIELCEEKDSSYFVENV